MFQKMQTCWYTLSLFLDMCSISYKLHMFHSLIYVVFLCALPTLQTEEEEEEEELRSPKEVGVNIVYVRKTS